MDAFIKIPISSSILSTNPDIKTYRFTDSYAPQIPVTGSIWIAIGYGYAVRNTGLYIMQGAALEFRQMNAGDSFVVKSSGSGMTNGAITVSYSRNNISIKNDDHVTAAEIEGIVKIITFND